MILLTPQLCTAVINLTPDKQQTCRAQVNVTDVTATDKRSITFADLYYCLIIRWWRWQPHLLPCEPRPKPFVWGWLRWHRLLIVNRGGNSATEEIPTAKLHWKETCTLRPNTCLDWGHPISIHWVIFRLKVYTFRLKLVNLVVNCNSIWMTSFHCVQSL